MSPPPTNQQTNIPTMSDVEVPTHYISVRLTIDHSRWDEAVSIFEGMRWLAWPHLGKSKDNPHYHVLVVESDAKVTERIRKRARDKLKLSGNGQFRAKLEGNGILNAITYCAKEGTVALHSHEEDRRLIDMAPDWEHRDGIGQYMMKKGQKPLHEDHFKELTYRNLEKATLRYHQQYSTKPTLEDTLEHMHQHGWRLNIAVIRGGIPSTFYDEFEAKCKGGSIWKKSKFAMMRVVPGWQGSI